MSGEIAPSKYDLILACHALGREQRLYGPEPLSRVLDVEVWQDDGRIRHNVFSFLLQVYFVV